MSSQQSKLRSYLDAQKAGERKGPPPTNTTCMLESLLDDPKKKKTKSTKASSAAAKYNRQKTNKSDSLESSCKLLTDSNSIWSKAVSQSTQTVARSSARTLDDLLEPRKQLSCLKRSSSQSTGSYTKPLKKPNRKQEISIELTKSTTMSHESNVSASTLPCSLIMRRQGAVRKPKFSNILKRQEAGHIEKNTLSTDSEGNLTTLQTFPRSPSIDNGKELMVLETSKEIDTSTKSLTKAGSKLTVSVPCNRYKPVVPSPTSIRKNISKYKTNGDPHPQLSAPIKDDKPLQTASYGTNKNTTTTRIVNNDNFVRLNMKNSAGACRGARNLKQHNRMKRRRAEWKQRTNQLGVERSDDDNDDDNQDNVEKYAVPKNTKKSTIQSVIDPIDDFLDGTFHAKVAKKSLNKSSIEQHPTCPRHLRPCKLLTVKKNTSGNKGRKFYACSMPRGEQCDFFQWQDDTIEVSFCF
jgi:GRF zinc finger.